jgi:hypothetical protein
MQIKKADVAAPNKLQKDTDGGEADVTGVRAAPPNFFEPSDPSFNVDLFKAGFRESGWRNVFVFKE